VQAVNVLTASLLDAAYFERAVVDGLSAAPYGWDFIVCANQQCNALERIALGQPEFLWKPTGVDTRRGGVQSQVSCFTHYVEGWSAPVTIVARRWREEGELPGLWHTSFLATRIAPGDVPALLRRRCGGDYGAVDPSERGIALRRLRGRYFRIAGYVVRTGHTLLVRLSGVTVDALRQTLWRKAFAAAGRLYRALHK
jgi:hypothetical protein